MNELLERVIGAHGGMERWNGFDRLSARVRGGGALWSLKQQEGMLDDYVISADLHRQRTEITPFGSADLRAVFTPERVLVQTVMGEVVEERADPRAAFAGHELTTAWDRLHLAYFSGYAMWTYLTEPFSLAGPGFTAEELEPWREDGETWRRLKVVFPADVTAHTRENVYFVDGDGLIRRHDYVAEVLGTPVGLAAHYLSGHRTFDGIVVPTERRVWMTDGNGHPVKEPLIVSIDISGVTFA